MKKYFRKEKPKNNQIIGFKTIESFFPEIGVFQTFDNGIEEVYIPANDDVEQLINIEYWFEIPQNYNRSKNVAMEHNYSIGETKVIPITFEVFKIQTKTIL